MIRKRQFHQGDEARKAPLARGHFLAHHPGMAVAEEKNQAATRNPIGAEFARLLNYPGLSGSQVPQSGHRAFEEGQACAARRLVIHDVPFTLSGRGSPPVSKCGRNDGSLGWHRVRIMHNDCDPRPAQRSF